MSREDSIKILKECDSGVKMALDSLRCAAEKPVCADMKNILQKSVCDHEAIELDISRQLYECSERGKQPGTAATIMARAKTAAKAFAADADSAIAGVITDGCAMGIKQLSEYINKYPAADIGAKNTARELIRCEQELSDKLRSFL